MVHMLRERRDGAVAWLTFDRPERLNAFTAAGYRELRVALQRLARDDAVRAVVLTGRGRAFCAGADRSLLDPETPASVRQHAGDEFLRLLDVLGGFEKPLLAAVNGEAVGFGCTLLLYCDLVLIAETARLRFPFTALGIVPEAGSSVLLSARMRWADAMWAMLSSEWIDAAAAFRTGLAWRVVPDPELLEQVSSAATLISTHDANAVAATKRLMTNGRRHAALDAVSRELTEMQALLRP
ncbi:enoyl-CoA hydratase/isomerase family protein [Mycobacterium intracellulare]|uniref:Enoyl-CoA hydratase/isomerase family protein n=1 Tax=Mycobacterium intracellulare TaxID=1767 RepID=A0AAE4RF99_MYCIT|nr:enoyl-CoA hydratase/isomerase family protein [Mycobacterium intracellulare]MDV6977048.1 enoyl-CoA hydratase/isomerase family protein [Mycobacterium intracellulare]MDV6982345.1 enoyl-CoA hydratase/isomerase family protein [Mycobacterium intracellulare]MDV7011871.1 enoyl-CoA hydratase/isomerase family protein [Mycobacterium intracellulare]MDV7026807.1 enoyl-CoA hydratase/isomerase family protein [Mycobacterium intracellulare]